MAKIVSLPLAMFQIFCLPCRLSDIGLKQFSAGKLLENLLAPTLALIIIMLQLKYFHRKSRDPPPAEVESEEGLRRSAEGQASPDVKGCVNVCLSVVTMSDD